jgi:hypothetical protein
MEMEESMHKLILGISLLGVGIYLWGRAEQSMVIQLCGFGLVAVMFTIFMARRRHS